MMRIAAILPNLPWPRDRGVTQQAGAFLDALAGAGQLDVACLVPEAPVVGAEAEVASRVARLQVVPVTLQPWRPLWRQMIDALPPNCRHWYDPQAAAQVTGFFAGQSYAVAMVFDLACLAYARAALPGVPLWLVRSRVDAAFQRDQMLRQGGGWADRLRLRLSERHERLAARLVVGQVVCAPSDAVAVRALAPAVREVLVVANGLSLADHPQPAPLPAAPQVLFVGAMDYPPNRDAMTWFVHTMWAAIRRAVPTASLRIVGRDPTPEIVALAQVEGVTVTGAVTSVVPEYHQARVVVAPIRIGGGTRLKVVEAWAMGRPLVATRVAVDGLAADDRNTLLGDTPADVAAAVISLLGDEQRCIALAEAGRATAARYDWSALTAPFIARIRAGR
jgi:glycosyltransferase involved in cell wall biosynthesis